MERAETPPKRPLTPFFMFIQKMKEKNMTVGGKEAGKAWAKLSSSEREDYENEYKKSMKEYEKYLVEVEGFKPKASKSKDTQKLSLMGKGVPDHFRAKRIRAVCGTSEKILPMAKKVYAGLGKVLVR